MMTQCQRQAANLLVILCTGNHDHTMPVVRLTPSPVTSPLPNPCPWDPARQVTQQQSQLV